MKITKEYVKNLTQGATLTMRCTDAANLDSVYQTSLKSRKELGLTADDMRVTRDAKGLRVEVERRENL